MRLAPVPLVDVLEKEWDAQLFNTKTGLATALGWTLTYHTLRSRGSDPGFVDRVLVRERVIFLELKREAGKLSAAQKVWIHALLAAGAECYVARPRDLSDLAVILAARGSVWANSSAVYLAASKLRTQTRDEAS